MTRALSAAAALALTALLTLAGCGSGGGNGSGGNDGAPLSLVGTWRLVRIDVPEQPPLVDGRPVTLRADADGNVGGSSACNSYFGVATIEGDRVTITDVGSTLIACPGAIGELERAYLAALRGVDRGVRDDGVLTLTGPAVRLVFQLEDE